MKTTFGEILENSVLNVSVPGFGYTTDPETGNPIPNSTEQTIHCYLSARDSPPKQLEASQPRDTPMAWVTGYVTRNIGGTSLYRLPVITNAGIDATIGGISGRLYLITKVPNAALQQYVGGNILGEEIWGWFDATA